MTPQRTIDHHGTANFNNRYIQCMLPAGTVAAYAEMDEGEEEDEEEGEEEEEGGEDEDEGDGAPPAKKHRFEWTKAG